MQVGSFSSSEFICFSWFVNWLIDLIWLGVLFDSNENTINWIFVHISMILNSCFTSCTRTTCIYTPKVSWPRLCWTPIKSFSSAKTFMQPWYTYIVSSGLFSYLSTLFLLICISIVSAIRYLCTCVFCVCPILWIVFTAWLSNIVVQSYKYDSYCISYCEMSSYH